MAEPDIDRDIVMAEVKVVAHPVLGRSEVNREPTNPSTTPLGTPPRQRAQAIVQAVRAHVTPPVAQQVDTIKVDIPRAARPTITTPIAPNSTTHAHTAIVTPAKISEAARMRARQQRLTASATRKEDEKHRARARQAKAAGQT